MHGGSRRRSRNERQPGFTKDVASGAIDVNGIDGAARIEIDDLYNLLARGRELAIAEGGEGDKDRQKITAARRRHIFVTRRPLVIEPTLQKPVLDQRIKPPGQHVRRDLETGLEGVEAGDAAQRVAQNEHAPPLADPFEATGDGALHGLEALAAHGIPNLKARPPPNSGGTRRRGASHLPPTKTKAPAHADFSAFASIGSLRNRLPVAAKTALTTAGAMPEVPGSPAPPGASWLSTI